MNHDIHVAMLLARSLIVCTARGHYLSYYCSAVAIFELSPSTSEVDEDVSGGQAQVFVRLAATSGELTFNIDVTIETASGGTATGEFIGK